MTIFSKDLLKISMYTLVKKIYTNRLEKKILCIGLNIKVDGRQPDHVTSVSSNPPMTVAVSMVMVMVVKVIVRCDFSRVSV